MNYDDIDTATLMGRLHELAAEREDLQVRLQLAALKLMLADVGVRLVDEIVQDIIEAHDKNRPIEPQSNWLHEAVQWSAQFRGWEADLKRIGEWLRTGEGEPFRP